MSTVELILTSGKKTLVDSDVAAQLEGRKISATSGIYPYFREGLCFHSLHRYIMKPPAGMVVDHINGNTLDNRRANLRIVTQAENAMNIHKRSKCPSGYRAVYFAKNIEKCWRLRFRGTFLRRMHVGYFYSRHVAGIFADEILLERVGDFVLKNFERDICRGRLRVFLEATRGRIFRVAFSRRSDGRQREMTCRIGVTKHLKGQGPSYRAADHDLMSVYDVQKRQYRSIPLDRVLCVRFAKVNFRVVS